MNGFTNARVLVMMGSKSDWPVMQGCTDRLKSLGIPYVVHVASAHRTPEYVEELIAKAEANNVELIIAAAGMAAHLAGAVAARTILPVIGIPIDAAPLNGIDSLLSTVQMPPNMPVLTVGIGRAGAVNAAVAAAQILSRSDEELRARLLADRKAMRENIFRDDQELPRDE
ncbi:5-(carboxyamino)imidazole ribonucleotide mutase [bacterium]|nr:5-(carboxyamino)imidazole ribonucleotide mutase [bacterium]